MRYSYDNREKIETKVYHQKEEHLQTTQMLPPNQPLCEHTLTLAERASILRRMRFAAHSRSVFDKSMGAITRPLHLALKQSPQLVPDRLVQIFYDLAESARLGHVVPNIGNVRSCTPLLKYEIPQVAGDEGFIYDPTRHVLIGTHVGVDLVQSNGRFYVVDINGAAAMKASRRRLYPSLLDPVIYNLVEEAKDLGFPRLVVVRSHWEQTYQAEWIEAGKQFGVDVIPTCYSWFDWKNPNAVARFPREYAENTMYASFGNRYSAFEFFLNDKIFANWWIDQALASRHDLAELLAIPRASTALHVPPLSPDRESPNLVVKVSGKNSGVAVAMARVRTENEVLSALGMRSREDFPDEFSNGWLEPLLDRLFGRRQLLFQEYVPPTTDPRGHAQVFRLHVFVSPLAHRFLSSHKVVAPRPLPVQCQYGLIDDASAYVVNASRGASYAPLLDSEVNEVARAGEAFGQLLTCSARSCFSTKPAPA